jgi:hypothetical protein
MFSSIKVESGSKEFQYVSSENPPKHAASQSNLFVLQR